MSLKTLLAKWLTNNYLYTLEQDTRALAIQVVRDEIKRQTAAVCEYREGEVLANPGVEYTLFDTHDAGWVGGWVDLSNAINGDNLEVAVALYNPSAPAPVYLSRVVITGPIVTPALLLDEAHAQHGAKVSIKLTSGQVRRIYYEIYRR